MSVCRSCGAPILWAQTVNDRRIPIDADPVDDGNLVLTYPSPGTALALVVDPAQTTLGDPPRYISHYVTCPDADSWRKHR